MIVHYKHGEGGGSGGRAGPEAFLQSRAATFAVRMGRGAAYGARAHARL